MLRAKHILVGISGGIAAYKIPELIRHLRKAGADVRVCTTPNALEFVTELTLRTLSGAPVYSDVFAAINSHSTEHISLPEWADMMVVAPATANVLAKMAHGIADDALTTTFCTTLVAGKPIVIAPAMNDNMYNSPATQASLNTLRSWANVRVLDCAEGELACGTSGKGRMQEPDVIAEAVRQSLTPQDLLGRHVLITAGPTREKIDPVRYISNYSSGKMGTALALACARRGAHVTLIAGPMRVMPDFTAYPIVNVVHVESAREMHEAALAAWPTADTAVLCAAVADFAPAETAPEKLKKQPGQTEMLLRLTLNPDIAAALGGSKRPGQRIIGFALETQNEEANALRKMHDKGLDFIVLNSLQDAGAGFGTDTNKVTIYALSEQKRTLPLMSKQAVAEQIVSACIS